MTLRSILKDFVEHVQYLEKRRLVGDNLYDREFQKLKQITDRLKNDPNYTCKAGQSDANRRKNRYKDILPYDHTRVILADNEDPYSDYINASYIKGSSGSMAYIAAQGPLPHTVNDFWRMVWQCEVQVVVMACNEREGGKTKCDYYWPGLGEKKLYQDIMIHTVKAKKICEDFLVRTWKLTRGSEQRTVCQFHYTTWPDHGIPSSVNPILQMIRLIRNCQATETIPVLVHCSAGCGRTGTFCAIDQVWGLLRSGKLYNSFSLFSMVSDMRHQRVAMVQTKEQYMLVHRAVATLFQQQLCIIDSHPYQNISQLGEPLAFIQDHHIYENVKLLQSIIKNESNPAHIKMKKPAVSHMPRLDTPPTSGTDTDHSSEEFEVFDARYNPLNADKMDANRSVTLPPQPRFDNNGALPTKKQSQTLVISQEEQHIKQLLTDLKSGQSTYMPRNSRPGSQDDIKVTYSPERSLVYISDSDNSDGDATLRPEVVRKPSIAKLKEVFERSNCKLEAPRREITRSHSQRVTRSSGSPLVGSQFYVPVVKSDSFNVFDNKGRPNVNQRSVNNNEKQGRNPSPNFNTISYMQTNRSEVPEKPSLPMKQRNVTNVQPTNRNRNHCNEFTSTGTRKPPVLPRKKFIGGRGAQCEAQHAVVGSDLLQANKNICEDEAERFHGSGGSIFYGPCTTDFKEAVADEVPKTLPSKKTPYTNVTIETQKNMEQIQTVIDQSPRGAIIDLTSTVRKAPPLAENKSSSDKSTDSDSCSAPVKKVGKGYEPIWVGPGQKMSSSTCDDTNLIRENNYGKITPRCKSEEKLLECSSPPKVVVGAYGRITGKASSEPPMDSPATQSDTYSSSDSSTSSSNLLNGSKMVPNLLVHSPMAQRKLSGTGQKPEFNIAVAEIRNLIDELMFDSTAAPIIQEAPKRERCHSLDLLCPEQNEAADPRRRRPSTDLLDDSKTIHNIPQVLANENIPPESNDSVYFTAEQGSNPPDVDYKAISSTVLRQNQRCDGNSDLFISESPTTKRSKANIKRSVSAREAKRPMVVKRVADHYNGSATMRLDYPKTRNQSLGSQLDPNLFQDDGYVTLAETQLIRTDRPKPAEDSHQYATIHHMNPPNLNRFSYRTLPQTPITPQDQATVEDEHIYSLPTLPKCRPPPPPPQQQKPDFPTPPPSSEETSSSSSQGDSKAEPLYSQIQKSRKEPPQFVLADGVVSTGYGHIIAKQGFSHDDLEVSDKPVAPPRRGRRQHKYARHSLMDIDCKNYNPPSEDFQIGKSSAQWSNHYSTVADDASDCEDSAPNIPQKTAAAFQLPDESNQQLSEVGCQAGPVSDV